jgi:hypothetical protein
MAWVGKAGGLSFAVGSDACPQLNTAYFSRPSVSFGDGSSTSWLTSSTAVSYETPITVFKVVYWPTPSGSYAALAVQNGAYYGAINSGFGRPLTCVLTEDVQTAFPRYAASNDSDLRSLESAEQDAPHLYTFQITSDLTAATLRVDGVPVSVDGYGTAVSPGTFDTIGSSDGTYPANGALAEVLVYEGALSPTDIAAVEAYLTAKWLSSSSGVSVEVEGVAAAAELGAVAVREDTAAAPTGVASSAVVGDASLKLDFSVFPTGVQGTIARGFVLVWSAVDDMQTPDWQNVADSQSPGWVPVADTQTPNWN